MMRYIKILVFALGTAVVLRSCRMYEKEDIRPIHAPEIQADSITVNGWEDYETHH